MPEEKLDKKNFMFMEQTGQVCHKKAGDLNGKDFLIDGCKDCTIIIEDHTAQVQIDYCENCVIFLAPVNGPCFIRNSKNITLKLVCQQLRTREIEDCDVLIYNCDQPSIEMSKNIRFGTWDPADYPPMEEQMKAANMPAGKNKWKNIYDFSPKNPANCTHFTIMSDDEMKVANAKVLDKIKEISSDANDDDKKTASDTKKDADKKEEEFITGVYHMKIGRKFAWQRYYRACVGLLDGSKGKVDGFVLTGFSSAIPNLADLALKLETEQGLKVKKVNTIVEKLTQGQMTGMLFELSRSDN